MANHTIPSFLRIQLAGLFALALVLYAVIDYLILPIHSHYREAETALAHLISSEQNLETNLLQLKSNQKKLAAQQTKVDESFDSMESESLDPLEWLHNVSERSGISIKSFQDHRNGIVNSLPAVDINMQATGDYSQICTFLNNLERSSRPCFINRFTISNNSNSDDQLTIEARFLVFPVSTEFHDLLNSAPVFDVTSQSSPVKSEGVSL
jgi:Tfp pilus assembly protein PilO